MSSYRSFFWCFICLCLWQSVVTVKAMYFRKHIGIKMSKLCFEKKEEEIMQLCDIHNVSNGLIWSLKVWVLAQNDIWSWKGYIYRVRKEKSLNPKGEKVIFFMSHRRARYRFLEIFPRAPKLHYWFKSYKHFAVGGVALGRVWVCSLRSRLVFIRIRII